MPTITIGGEAIANWEVPESIAWDYFLADLAEARKAPVTIVEGFILFGDPKVSSLCEFLWFSHLTSQNLKSH
jgi:hypothetical protein